MVVIIVILCDRFQTKSSEEVEEEEGASISTSPTSLWP